MERSLAVTLGIAAIAHALANAVVRPHVRHAAAPIVVDDSQEVILVEANEPVEPAAPTAPTAPAPAPPTPHLAHTPRAKLDAQKTIELPANEPAAAASPTAAEAPPSPAQAPAGDAPKVATKFPSLLNLDAPGSHAVIFPTSSADVTEPTKAAKEKAAAAKLDTQLKSALDAKDTETGSGFGGPVVSVAHSTAGASTAMGYATFDVSTDAFGTVTMVRVVDFGGDGKSWQAMAKDLHASLGGRKLRVPTGAAGVSVRIRIEAAMKYPSGAVKPVSPMIGPGTVGGSFDVADIGQSKKRMVSVRIVSESRI